ncbi:hypothetical protein GCM10027360_79160 [Amycolatopsis echigonensis]
MARARVISGAVLFGEKVRRAGARGGVLRKTGCGAEDTGGHGGVGWERAGLGPPASGGGVRFNL